MRAVTIFLNDEQPTETSTKETNNGAASKGNGVEQADSDTAPADGDVAHAEKDQTPDRENRAAVDET